MKTRKCDSCGARLKYDKDNLCYKCEYCGAVYPDEEAQKKEEINNQDVNRPLTEEELLPEDFYDMNENEKKMLHHSHVVSTIITIVAIAIFLTVAGVFIYDWVSVSKEMNEQHNDFNDHWNDDFPDDFPSGPDW